MGVPVKFYTWVDSQADAGKMTAARLNGNIDPLYACLDPALGGLEDTNVKAGAKILCSDRSYTGASLITGTFEFQTFPTVPNASIPDAKLSSNVMLKTTYDTGPSGVVDNAERLGGELPAFYAPATKGVTNGDSHDHVGGDGAAIVEAALTLADNTTGDVTTARHGFVPKAPNLTTQFLRGDATWAAGIHGYALPVGADTFSPLDSTTYYFGSLFSLPPSTGVDNYRQYIPVAGVITAAYIFMQAAVAGTAEDISVYIRKNDTSDTLIATLGVSANKRVFSNTGLSISVAVGDYVEIKMVCPAWATNPDTSRLGGNFYVQV